MKIKKTLSLLMATLLLLLTCFVSVNAENEEEIYIADNVSLIFSGDVDEDIKEMVIADFIKDLNGDNGEEAGVYGLTCTLFGHKYVTTYQSEIQHKVYASAPRCVKNIYAVNTCSRCGNVEKKLSSSTRINCCS